MSAALAVLVAALPNAFLFVFAKVVTQSFMQSVIEKVLIYGLRKAAALTTNTLDDELVEEVATRLQSGGTQ